MTGGLVIDAGAAWLHLAQAEIVPPAVDEAAPRTPAGGELTETVLVEEQAEEAAFPPFDSTYFASQLLWLAITFTALYLLMARVVLPRIGGILEDRRDRIARDLDQAERSKQQSNEAIASYQRALAEARGRAFKIASEARDAAKADAATRQTATEVALDQKLVAAEKRIGEIKTRALADVGEIAAGAAEAVVQRLIGWKPTSGDIAAAVADARRSSPHA